MDTKFFTVQNYEPSFDIPVEKILQKKIERIEKRTGKKIKTIKRYYTRYLMVNEKTGKVSKHPFKRPRVILDGIRYYLNGTRFDRA